MRGLCREAGCLFSAYTPEGVCAQHGAVAAPPEPPPTVPIDKTWCEGAAEVLGCDPVRAEDFEVFDSDDEPTGSVEWEVDDAFGYIGRGESEAAAWKAARVELTRRLVDAVTRGARAADYLGGALSTAGARGGGGLAQSLKRLR
jgi:hypothetical protein